MMIRKIKSWFYDRFLPMWAKETVLADNRRLLEEVKDLRQQLECKDAYIAGLEVGIRAQRRIIINTGEGKK
ncbi:MAG: hypothetical protein IJF02_05080 [Oscillospiraceae bacterium]|nr:hypothetical protein [Oscillospiraceae bacterium]